MMTILNSPELAGFYALSAVAIFASLRVITQANPVHAILSMIVLLLSISGIMFVIGAPFAGALEIVVYAGAIMVLFVFVIMMLNLGMENDAHEDSWLDAKTWAVPTGLTLIIAAVFYAMIGLGHDNTAMIGGTTVSAAAVGEVLFSKYVMLVEISALLLLAALVAAYHLGKETIDDKTGDDDHQNLPLIRTDIKKEDISLATIDSTDVTEPYEYQEVNPHDYVGMQIGMPKVARKEPD